MPASSGAFSCGRTPLQVGAVLAWHCVICNLTSIAEGLFLVSLWEQLHLLDTDFSWLLDVTILSWPIWRRARHECHIAEQGLQLVTQQWEARH